MCVEWIIILQNTLTMLKRTSRDDHTFLTIKSLLSSYYLFPHSLSQTPDVHLNPLPNATCMIR